MKSLLSVVLLFGVLAAVPERSLSQSNLNQTAELTDQYKVYNAVIGKMFADNKLTFDFGGKAPVKLLVIEERTVSDPWIREVPWQRRSDMITPNDAMRADYRIKNQHPVTLKRWFVLTVDYELVNTPESKRAAYEKEDNEVHGIVGLSRVGFNKARTEAYVYMRYVCGMGCGQGFTFWMVKSGETWKVEKIILMWTS